MCQVGRKIIAKKIKNFRENKKLTREQLSLLLGMDNSYISKLEKFKVNITIDRLEQIAKLLDKDINDFLKD